MTDDEIICAVRNGQTRQFEILIERYSKKIITFIMRMLGDRDEAHNLTQDVFLNIYENLAFYKAENNFSAYIYRIARNITINYIKKNRRVVFFSHLFGKSAHLPEFASPDQTIHNLEKDQQVQMLDQALLKLNENQRLALILKVYLDLSYKEIAQVTSWSIPKIETLISRAKDNLQKHISLQENSVDFVLHQEAT